MIYSDFDLNYYYVVQIYSSNSKLSGSGDCFLKVLIVVMLDLLLQERHRQILAYSCDQNDLLHAVVYFHL